MLREIFEKNYRRISTMHKPPIQIVETIPLVTKAHSDSRRMLCMELTHPAHMLHVIALHRIVVRYCIVLSLIVSYHIMHHISPYRTTLYRSVMYRNVL